MKNFNSTFNYNIIYLMVIKDESHKGLIKIGKASIDTVLTPDELFANSHALKVAAHERIKTYTNTAGIKYELLHTELAVYHKMAMDGSITLCSFIDKTVHKVLERSGYSRHVFNDSTGKEWYPVDLQTAKSAIKAVKNGKTSLTLVSENSYCTPIEFRPEQNEAIQKTLKQFKHGTKMLWNAKMRFGKTLTALELVKRMNFSKTIIVTHRPVVNEGWYEDFKKIFYDTDEFSYGSKVLGFGIKELEDSYKNYIYFMSVQDLRGSEKIGGQLIKNEEIFNIDWDFVVVDEAHEGTKTSLGEEVVKALVKEESDHITYFLALSGTPFNIVHEYSSEELFTWDYIMEQKSKRDWHIKNFGDSNPYDSLPKMNIYTYNLGKLLGEGFYEEIEDKAFNFKEFFRTWTGDIAKDFKSIPVGQEIGDFCHEQDVISFLNLITKTSEDNNYPYSNESYRSLFKHSLWMLPGVKEAKALSKLLKSHSIFGSGIFEIINVAGDGDKEEESRKALDLVKNTINKALITDTYTITLSCGKLTTGVTIPEWSAVMMLSGSYNTSAANYLQTIFRVQSPGTIDGRVKENCYVFDFAPDRTLKMVADAVNLSNKAGETTSTDRAAMGEFLNFCPVVSIDGTEMKKYNENHLLQQLKRAYAERAVRNGFDDVSIYNNIELSKLTDTDLESFAKLGDIIKTSKQGSRTKGVEITDSGLTEEEYDELKQTEKKTSKQRTEDEERRLKELKEKQKIRTKAISNLRALSIRIPLLIYGADVAFDDDITAEKLVDIVDDSSWFEFMPKGITKELFMDFIKYYDADVFVAAGRKIRSIVKHADTLDPTQRVQKLTELFQGFKNPDKETVLTPWRVVNMHMSGCLGGYDFYNDNYDSIIEIPRFVNRGNITSDTTANINSKILEINSKTGLYPLYVAYSLFRIKCQDIENTSLHIQNELWEDTIKNNIFIICKTPMAKAITRRTLVGFRNIRINAHYFDDLNNTLKNKQVQFLDRVTRPNYWHLKGSERVKFDAVVGNPPYQEEGENSRKSPIYHLFYNVAFDLADIASLISPARFLFNAGQTPKEWNQKMLNDPHIKVVEYFDNSREVFPSAEIKGGVAILLRNKKVDFGSINIFTKYDELNLILSKVHKNEPESVATIVTGAVPYAFAINVKNDRPDLIELIGKSFDLRTNIFDKLIGTIFLETNPNDGQSYTKIFGLENKKRVYRWIKSEYILTAKNFKGHKVLIPKAIGKGEFGEKISNPIIVEPKVGHTQSFVSLGNFENMYEAENLLKYLKSKFFRCLLHVLKTTPDITPSKFIYVPLQDFTENSDIDWSKPISEIDQQLYKKYGLSESEIGFIEEKIKPM